MTKLLLRLGMIATALAFVVLYVGLGGGTILFVFGTAPWLLLPAICIVPALVFGIHHLLRCAWERLAEDLEIEKELT